MYTEEKKKKKRKKRGDQIELKLRVLSTGAKIKSGDDNSIHLLGKKEKEKERKEGAKLSSNLGY
jgi:hypothetical protein